MIGYSRNEDEPSELSAAIDDFIASLELAEVKLRLAIRHLEIAETGLIAVVSRQRRRARKR